MHDLRFALRRLRASSGFTAVAVLTLAVGIGANSAAFSLVNRILFRPLPVNRPAGLVFLNQVKGRNAFPSFSYPDYKDFRDRNQSLAALAGYRILAAGLTHNGSNSRVWGYMVTGNYFEMLGVTPFLGRTIAPTDDVTLGAHPVMVLTYAYWQQRFAADPRIIGRSVKVNGLDYSIIGVLPKPFRGTELFFNPDAFFSLSMVRQLEPGFDWIQSRSAGNLFLLGRLRPGITSTRAEAELDSIAVSLGREYPTDDNGMHVRLSPPGLAGSFLRGAVVGFTAVLLGVTALVLLIACTNLAGLMLARASDRRREIGIRLALGASRWRLIRQMLVESLVLSAAGAAAGLALSTWITSAVAAWRPPADIPLDLSSGTDLRVFLFACALAVLTSVVFGLTPALQAVRTDLLSSLKNAGSSVLRKWALRDGIVALQVALSVVLLSASVLVLRSLQNASTIPIGFDPRGAATVAFDLAMHGYSDARGYEFQRRLIEKVRALPGVESAALADRLPLSLNDSRSEIYVEGRPAPKPAELMHAFTYDSGPGYFKTMHTRLLAGRDFEARDADAKTRYAIVNQAFVDLILGPGPVLGRRFRFGVGGTPREIIGVVENGKYFSLGETGDPAVWDSLDQGHNRSFSVVARSGMPEGQLLALLRKSVLDLDPSIVFLQASTLTGHMRLPLLPARIAASALGGFGAIALLLAAIGVYGLMAYSVARRTREIGLRVALGAQSGHVLRSVMGRASALLAIGLVLGIAGALAGGPLFKAILFNVNPRDPMIIALAAALMVGIGFTACLIPARRAMSIDPSIALREE